MPHANATKKVRWEGIEPCAILGQTSIFLQASEIFQCSQAVRHEDGSKSWRLDHFSHDAVEPFSYGFIVLDPHGWVNVYFTEGGCELW